MKKQSDNFPASTANKKMAEHFNNLVAYIDKLKSRYFHALSAFHIYEALNQLVGEDVHGREKAQQFVDTIKLYGDYYVVTKEATRVYFFLELAKLFDTSDQALHINKVVNYTAAHRGKLTASDFLEHDEDRAFAEELASQYVGIANEDIESIRESLAKHADTLKNLKDYRDKWLAHDDMNKPELPKISPEEIEALFKTLDVILNSLSSKLISTRTMWDDVKPRARHSAESVFENLGRYEPYRRQEIYAEADEMLKKLTQGIEVKKKTEDEKVPDGTQD